MREAGLVVGRTLRAAQAAVRPGISTADLDEIAEEAIRGRGRGRRRSGYQRLPGLHLRVGQRRDRARHPVDRRSLRDGDIISIDCGAIVDGWHGDAAVTVAVGAVPPRC